MRRQLQTQVLKQREKYRECVSPRNFVSVAVGMWVWDTCDIYRKRRMNKGEYETSTETSNQLFQGDNYKNM